MKLMVAIPTNDYVHYEFTRSLVNLVHHLDELGINYDVHFHGGTLVYMARDALAADAINQKYTHVLWLDADMAFDETLFDHLVRHGADFVTGVYHARRPPYDSCIFSELEPWKKVEVYPREPFFVEGCGFGCVLMKTEVLTKVFREFGMCFQPSPELGEDLEFCKRAKKLGYKVLCDPDAIAGHIGQLVIKPNMKRE